MAICRDPVLSYLNDQGYNVVRLPRMGIDPLDVLGKDGRRLERLGTLPQIWSSDTEMPQVSAPRPAVGINGQETAELKLSIGLRLLGDILKAFGVEGPELDTAYGKARSLQLGFLDVDVVSIDPFAIGNYLASGDLDTRNPVVARYFEDDDTDVYVIFEILRSSKISVVAKNNSGTEMSLDVEFIQDTIGGNVTVSRESGRENLISYVGRQSLTFGFKVFGLAYEDGNWRVQGIAPSPDLAFDTPLASAAVAPSTILSTSGRVVLK